jgi:hypothetical protein
VENTAQPSQDELLEQAKVEDTSQQPIQNIVEAEENTIIEEDTQTETPVSKPVVNDDATKDITQHLRNTSISSNRR